MTTSWYARAILRWERELNSRDPHRVVRPFEWGWEWLRATPIDGLPQRSAELNLEALQGWTERALSSSDVFFSYPRVRDYRLVGDRLQFSSPIPSPYPENQTVHARWFPADHRGGRKRAVVVLPQWNSDGEGHMGLGRLFQRFGVSALRMSPPYHDVRMPGDLKRAEYTVDSNVGRTIAAARQAVCDVRACLDWLEDQGYESLGVMGTSLGSCYAFLTTCHDARLRVNAFNHVSAYFGDVVWTGISTRHVKAGLATHLGQDALREAWRVISPFSYLNKLAKPEYLDGGAHAKRHLLVYARYDPTFLPEYSRDVLAAFRRLQIPHQSVALPCGHYTIGRWPFKVVDGYTLTRFLCRWL
ncbi:MAG: alpha/beta hydrolase family protein [Terriglobales bacterium]